MEQDLFQELMSALKEAQAHTRGEIELLSKTYEHTFPDCPPCWCMQDDDCIHKDKCIVQTSQDNECRVGVPSKYIGMDEGRIIDEFNAIGCTSFRMSAEEVKATKDHVEQKYKQSKIRKIPVGIVYDDIDTVNRMLCELEPQPLDMVVHRPGLVETRSLIVYLIKSGGAGFCGVRLSFVYTTKEIAKSEWFKTVIRPMLTGGIGEIV